MKIKKTSIEQRTQEVSVVESPVVIVIVPPAVVIAASEVVCAHRPAILAIGAYRNRSVRTTNGV